MEVSCSLALVSLLLFNVLSSSNATLALGMTPCPREADNFNDCVLNMVNVIMAAIVRGELPQNGTHEPINLNLTLNLKKDDLLSLHIEGKRKSLLKGVEMAAIRNFNFDIDVLRMSFNFDIPQMRVDTPCTVEGYFGSRNYEPNPADGIVLHAVFDRYSATFEYTFELKTNCSGRFLVPTLSFHEGKLDSSTLNLENFFPADNPPSVHEREIWKVGEEFGGNYLADVIQQLIEKLISQFILTIMEQNSYDELYPGERPIPAVPCSASTLTSGSLGLATLASAVILLRV